jgi:hypothetical protein
MRDTKPSGWGSFAAWTIAGGLITYSILDLPAYGLFALPVAALLIVFLAGRIAFKPDGLGLIVGCGALVLFVAWRNRDFTPCPPSGTFVLRPGQVSASCGGLTPVPWLVSGAVMIAAGFVGYALSRRRIRRRLGSRPLSR